MGITGILLSLLSPGQPALRPLNIGDTVPAVALGTLLNYSKPVHTLSSFKGKLVILDFMNTFCGNCISALPALDALQHKYADKLQICMVLNEPEDRVLKFLKNNPVAKGITLPVIAGDTTLQKLFPHSFVSHEAWIYNGTVKAITASDYVTEQNILTLLAGISPGWPVKNDRGDYDYDAPLLTLSDRDKEYITNLFKIVGSVLTPSLKGVAVRYTEQADTIHNTITIKAINYSIARLYLHTLTDWQNFPISHVRLPVSNPGFFAYVDKTQYRDVWEENNTYCYELTYPAGTLPEIIRRKIQADLDTYLGVESSFEVIKTTGYVLVEDSSAAPSGLERRGYEALSAGASKTEIVFPSPALLVEKLNQCIWGIPIYDGMSPGIQVAIKIDENSLADIPALNAALKPQRLMLKQVTKEVSMLVLNKAENNFPTKAQN